MKCRSKNILAGVLLCGVAGFSPAAMVLITNSPHAWRLENYVGGSVVLWYTSSPCPSGLVTFESNASQAEMNRFWATVSTAKAAGKKMFLYYDDANAPARCPIVSFGLDAE